jgi:hypothetical protein
VREYVDVVLTHSVHGNLLKYLWEINSCSLKIKVLRKVIYSGGKDQEDHGSKPAQANSLRVPIFSKIYFNFLIFTFTHMCIHCLGHPPTQTSEQNLVLS